nr:ferrochelatase [Paenibacillus sp. JJ-223]
MRTGDPYERQSCESAEQLADLMGWPSGKWQISFQSRFGKERWIRPSTADELRHYRSRGQTAVRLCALLCNGWFGDAA